MFLWGGISLYEKHRTIFMIRGMILGEDEGNKKKRNNLNIKWHKSHPIYFILVIHILWMCVCVCFGRERSTWEEGRIWKKEGKLKMNLNKKKISLLFLIEANNFQSIMGWASSVGESSDEDWRKISLIGKF